MPQSRLAIAAKPSERHGCLVAWVAQRFGSIVRGRTPAGGGPTRQSAPKECENRGHWRGRQQKYMYTACISDEDLEYRMASSPCVSSPIPSCQAKLAWFALYEKIRVSENHVLLDESMCGVQLRVCECYASQSESAEIARIRLRPRGKSMLRQSLEFLLTFRVFASPADSGGSCSQAKIKDPKSEPADRR